MMDEPIVMVGNWDSAPVFLTRKGGYQMKERLGFSNVKYVEPPEFNGVIQIMMHAGS